MNFIFYFVHTTEIFLQVAEDIFYKLLDDLVAFTLRHLKFHI